MKNGLLKIIREIDSIVKDETYYGEYGLNINDYPSRKRVYSLFMQKNRDSYVLSIAGATNGSRGAGNIALFRKEGDISSSDNSAIEVMPKNSGATLEQRAYHAAGLISRYTGLPVFFEK